MDARLLSNQTAIVTCVRAIAQELREGLTPTLTEGHIKVICFQALLREGFTLREGSHDSTKDKLIRLHNGELVVEKVTRIKARASIGLAGKWHTSDLRVEYPERLAVLLKAGSLLGTQDTLEHSKFKKDLDQINGGGADLLIVAADRKLYDDLRGVKSNKRGRRAHAPDQFRNQFPGSDNFQTGEVGPEHMVASSASGWLAVRTGPAAGHERLVIAWWPTRLLPQSFSRDSRIAQPGTAEETRLD